MKAINNIPHCAIVPLTAEHMTVYDSAKASPIDNINESKISLKLSLKVCFPSTMKLANLLLFCCQVETLHGVTFNPYISGQCHHGLPQPTDKCRLDQFNPSPFDLQPGQLLAGSTSVIPTVLAMCQWISCRLSVRQACPSSRSKLGVGWLRPQHLFRLSPAGFSVLLMKQVPC